jgi:phenylacetate-CoA ligase
MNIFKDLYFTFRGILLYNYFIKKSCYFDEIDLKKYQFKKLKNLLIIAYNDIPYYKLLFDSLTFNPKKDFNSLNDIEKLPILDKDFVRNNTNQFYNQRYLKNSIIFKTSGSSGNPLTVFVHPKQWILEQAVIWRHWKWGGYNFRDPLAMVRSYVPKNDKTLWKHNFLTNFTYYSPFHLNDENIQLYLNDMIKRNVKIIRGYPSSLKVIADFILSNNTQIPRIKLILTASEYLSDHDRNIIETAFKSKVFNHYGLAEQIVMMGDCEMHNGLHNYEEYGLLEFLDTDKPNIKKIIGTNLHNITTPLIRYDTGDLAILSEEKCTCGRNLPIIKNIIGRNDSCIITENNFKIPTVNFYTMFEDFAEIIQWQIVQVKKNEINFYIKTNSISDIRHDQLKNEILKRLGTNTTISILINQPFIKKNEGKLNTFISLLN